jgi:hypothetical protein
MFSIDVGVVKLEMINGLAIDIHKHGPISFACVHLLGYIDSKLA